VDACDACIETVYAFFGYDTGSTCADNNNPEACTAFVQSCDDKCMSSACQVEMLAKGECEVNSERSSNGSQNCEVMTCDPVTAAADAAAADADGNTIVQLSDLDFDAAVAKTTSALAAVALLSIAAMWMAII
jgi:hypothetical protein